MQVYYSQDIREEELKMRVSQDWFSTFDTAHASHHARPRPNHRNKSLPIRILEMNFCDS